MRRSEIAVLEEALRSLLGAIESGELIASTATRNRLQGAVVALDVVLNDRSTLLEELIAGDVDVQQLLIQEQRE